MKETTVKHMRACAVSLCGMALCCSMIAPAMGDVTAYAEQPSDAPLDAQTADIVSYESAFSADAARAVATSRTFVGWYLCGTHPTLGGLTYMSQTPGTAYGYNTSGTLVALPGVEADFGSHCAYIPADQLNSFLSASGLRLYDAQVELPHNEETVIDPYADVTWWALYAESPTTPTSTTEEPTEDIMTLLPETDLEDWLFDDPATAPEAAQTTDAVATAPTSAQEQPAPSDESVTSDAEKDTLTMQCRESETEAKVAELEAQGYEIVRIEKAPTWWR